jgi:ABC-type polysaccharide/polyol phosphate export permease
VTGSRDQTVTVLDPRPDSRRRAIADVWRHRHVLGTLARADFHVRYKRAAFGVAWAVVVPVVQAVVLALVFSRVVEVGSGRTFAVHVLAGVAAWGYFSATLPVAATAIVEGSGLTDKVWFPRALLPLVPALSGLVGLGVTSAAVVVAMPLLGVGVGPRVALLVPGAALLVALTAAAGLVLSALHVYFRDVRFIVQAALLVLFYLTPVVYPLEAVGGLRPLVETNPLTGVVVLFQAATVGGGPGLGVPLAVTLATTAALALAACETYRRHDRLFVDLL